MEMKEYVVDLYCVLFWNTRIISTLDAIICVEPLVSLNVTKFSPTHDVIVCALDNLLNDEQLLELITTHGFVVPLFELMFGGNHPLHEVVINSLEKLGKNRPLLNLDMIKDGVVENILEILLESPDSLCVVMEELRHILEDNNNIENETSTTKVVEPLFSSLTGPEFSAARKHSAMVVLVTLINCKIKTREVE